MSESMVERVAWAIADNLEGVTVEQSRYAALAAIAAMREPTERMTNAAEFSEVTGFSYGGDEHSFSYFSKSDAKTAWGRMIDAALKEPDQ